MIGITQMYSRSWTPNNDRSQKIGAREISTIAERIAWTFLPCRKLFAISGATSPFSSSEITWEKLARIARIPARSTAKRLEA